LPLSAPQAIRPKTAGVATDRKGIGPHDGVQVWVARDPVDPHGTQGSQPGHQDRPPPNRPPLGRAERNLKPKGGGTQDESLDGKIVLRG
jgi:hypothetical protein